MNILNAIKEIKENIRKRKMEKRNRNIKTIVHSGYIEEQKKLEELDEKIKEHLKKHPLNIDNRSIRKLAEEKKEKQEEAENRKVKLIRVVKIGGKSGYGYRYDYDYELVVDDRYK